jgi:hypothetical protein
VLTHSSNSNGPGLGIAQTTTLSGWLAGVAMLASLAGLLWHSPQHPVWPYLSTVDCHSGRPVGCHTEQSVGASLHPSPSTSQNAWTVPLAVLGEVTEVVNVMATDKLLLYASRKSS